MIQTMQATEPMRPVSPTGGSPQDGASSSLADPNARVTVTSRSHVPSEPQDQAQQREATVLGEQAQEKTPPDKPASTGPQVQMHLRAKQDPAQDSPPATQDEHATSRANEHAASGTASSAVRTPHLHAKKASDDARKTEKPTSAPKSAESRKDLHGSNAKSPKVERSGTVSEMLFGEGNYAFTYAAIGLIVAALILIVGFWPTVLMALFAGIGLAIGRWRDGDVKMRATVDTVLSHMHKHA